LSLNLYAYVQNNPLKNVDPSGHWCRATIDGVTYSHNDSCDDPSRHFDTPSDLQAILNDNSKRTEYVNNFFNNHQGSFLLKSLNYGTDVLAFMNWEISSGRLDKSKYWNETNAQMIADIYFTEQANYYEGWTKEERLWKEFIDKPDQKKMWSAHNASIAAGTNFAIKQGYLKQETQAEQVFIVMVLFRVGATALSDAPSWFGIIGAAMNKGSAFEYPWHYPATWDDPALEPFWGLQMK
jgi:hypothetical protein